MYIYIDVYIGNRGNTNMMTKDEWNKKWPQLAYNPSLLEGNNAEKAMNMTLDEKIKAMAIEEIGAQKRADFYNKNKGVFLQTPEQKRFNEDDDY